MTHPPAADPPAAASPRSRLRVDTWLGVRLHASLWLVLGLLVLARGHAALFPGLLSPYSTWGLGLALVALLVLLWRPGRAERIAKLTLHSVSLVAAFVIVAELLLGAIGSSQKDAQSRYPYPYRMHGYMPEARPATSTHGCTTNDTGLRAPGPIARKPAGVWRVVLLGGSTMFGHGADDARTPGAFLQGLLDQRLKAKPLAGVERIEVVNAGQGWYTSTNELVFLLTELLLYEPDAVVVVDGYNDAHHAIAWGNRPPANAVATSHVGILLGAPKAWRRSGWPRALHGVLNTSRLLDALPLTPDALLAGDAGAPPQQARGGGQRFSSVMQHRLVMNWTLIHRLGRQLGFRTAFALQPCLYEKRAQAEAEQRWIAQHPQAELMAEAWKQLRAHVDAEAARLGLPVFRADRYLSDDPRPLFTDYCHLVPEANLLLARAIAERLEVELATWPWKVRYEGVRYAAEDGDPIWRPLRLTDQTPWR